MFQIMIPSVGNKPMFIEIIVRSQTQILGTVDSNSTVDLIAAILILRSEEIIKQS